MLFNTIVVTLMPIMSLIDKHCCGFNVVLALNVKNVGKIVSIKELSWPFFNLNYL